MLKKFLIEREIAGVAEMGSCELAQAARTSNSALEKLAPRVQWQESFVTPTGTVCVYLAEDEKAIREHAELSGFPANRITEVKTVIDPTTALG